MNKNVKSKSVVFEWESYHNGDISYFDESFLFVDDKLVENQTDNWYERPQNDNSQTPNWNIIQTMCDKLSNFNNLDLPFVLSDLARDGSHLGKISHRKFAESVFEKIKDRL